MTPTRTLAAIPVEPELHEPTVSEVVADAIAAHADHVFGLVGNANSHIVSSLTRRGFPYTAVRHETATVAAADAFHRAGGGIAVATTTCGAGFTNTLTALAEAATARIPLVLVTGAAPAAPRPFDLDQAALVDALGVPRRTAAPGRAGAEAAAAFAEALAGRTPVVLEVPFDAQTAPAGDAPAAAPANPVPAPAPAAPDPAAVAALARRLAGAARPLIIAGRGVVDSGTAGLVAALADRLGALHMHTAMAANVLGGPWCLGTAGGFAHASRLGLTRAADVVLSLGASHNAFQVRGGRLLGPAAHVIQVVDEPHPAARPVDELVLADLRELLPALLDALAGPPGPAATWREELGALEPAEDPATAPGLFAETGADGRIDPRAALRRIDAALPAARTVVTDGGHFLGWVPKHLTATDPHGQVLVGTAVQSIGLGFGSAVGAAAARPGAATVLVTGDGGGLMALADLDSFLRTADRGAVVVLNDAAYGAELHQYAAEGLHTASMVIEDVDFAGLGRALGARGVTVADPADWPAAEAALAAPEGITVVDVKISREVVADFIAEVLKRQ
ncbi:thiamine pyrophosphate-binding protein [Corynebacterium sphenisci]|uniref:thiamine pyrophosphate-binding protein n=1 Tax=Corynebacterium sphenisci TaxID=191493 RepID=UPI0026DF8D2E|nr:thiamine pyrophosphate-binding protein [Corynebacterium sphenisci]MDO5732141.1 thiamine pyrophosphate-binding protein [Corynebacterium sphenisci]